MSLLNRVLQEQAKKQKVTFVYLLSFDLKDASSEYAKITNALAKLGYSRDSSAGEDTLPRNFYAGQKQVSYDPEEISLSDKIQQETEEFESDVLKVMGTEAQGKLDKYFLSVSPKKLTGIKIC